MSETNELSNVKQEESYFDGGLFKLVLLTVIGWLMIVLTFGLAYPWAACLVYGWKMNHTVIEGRRLEFNGTGLGLFGNWIKWLLLTFITFGIYGFWLGIAVRKWKVKNTTFAN